MRPTRRDDRERRATGVPAALVFAGTFVWGVLSWSGFHNDQFMHLGYHTLVLATQSPDVEATKPILYSTVLVLLMLTFALNFTAIIIRSQIRKRLRYGR